MAKDAAENEIIQARSAWTTEDWLAVWCGGLLLLVAFATVWISLPSDLNANLDSGEPIKISSPLKRFLAAPGAWGQNPIESFLQPATNDKPGVNLIPGVVGAAVVIGLLFAAASQLKSGDGLSFLWAFPFVFLLATLAYVLAGQVVIKHYNLEYVLWALFVGMLISNTVGTPEFLRPAMQTEFYIKTGLVLLGAEVLLNRLLALGLPGIFVSWIGTPITLISTYVFGQKVLKMESRSLNMVISADMSVCGVSAAIATGAACKAKKEELSLAVGLSLVFTVLMMVAMPWFIKLIGMDPTIAGAWLGGTIDSTGAVAAAGKIVGNRALEVAATVKMIQNILIGVISFGVALYWVRYIEADPNGDRPGISEVWRRFPRFILGFVFASVVFSAIASQLRGGPEIVDAMTTGSTIQLRGWLFCLAFVSIGLETNFRELYPYLKSGKALTLYVCGQCFNLCLALLLSWIMFGLVFKNLLEK